MSQVILTDEFLKHHGVKGMHWYQRRYQNPDGTLTEAGKKRYARHQAKLDTKINNAVTTGDKKKLSKLQDKMSPEQYEENYKRTVANGIQNAIMDRSKHELRKYKEDLDPRTYKQTKKRIDFKAAVDEGDNKKMKKLISQVKPEDIAEANQLINSRLSLKDVELKKIRQDTELMAKMDKLASSINKSANLVGSVANLANKGNAIINELNKFNQDAENKEKARKDKEKAELQSKVDKAVKSGKIDEINKLKDKMNNQQLTEAYNRINLNHQDEVISALQSNDASKIRDAAPYMDNKQMIAAVQKLENLDKINGRVNNSATEFIDDWCTNSAEANLRPVPTTNVDDFFANYSNTNRNDWRLRHSDFDPEEFLEHHGVLGMKWGVRRYQRKNGSLTPEGLARYRSVRKDIRTEAGKLKALETNMRNKADVAAPAELKRKKAEEFYEQTLRKSSKRSIFDSRAKREARAKDLRTAEYNLEDATKAAERSRKNFDKSQKIYDMQLEKLQNKIKSAKKDYGEFVNELVLSDVKLGETYSDKTNSDAMLWTKKMVNNYGMIKMADISKTVMEMEKLLDAKIAG